MRKNYFLFVVLFMSNLLNAQTADQLIRINSVTNASDMQNISSPQEGSLVYVESINNLFLYDGNRWNTIWTNQGNSATDSCFIGPKSNHDFRVRTNNSQQMVVKNDGKVGVNVNSPDDIFHVKTGGPSTNLANTNNLTTSGVAGSIGSLADNDLSTGAVFQTLSASATFNINDIISGISFSVIFSDQPTSVILEARNNSGNWNTLYSNSSLSFNFPPNPAWNTWATDTFFFNNSTSYEEYRVRGIDWHWIYEIGMINVQTENDFIVASNGNVGIDINNPTQKLHVSGNILATGSITPDYVFEKYFEGESELNPNYEFHSLEKVEDFIKEHKHLPGVPSAQKVEKQGGIIVNRATEINLEKIEELYLYLIELDKKSDLLQKKAKALNKESEIIEDLIQSKP